MIYIYDIIMNFNNNYYEFYDWKSNDKFVHVKKIPLIFVSTSNLKKLINYEVIVDNKFLKRIANKSYVHFQHDNLKYKYSCLISDGKKICGFIFNYTGKVILKSDLSVDEYTEILDLIKCHNKEEIIIKILKPSYINDFKTRNQLYKIKYVKDKIKNMPSDILDYIFYETIGKKKLTKEDVYLCVKNDNNIDLIYDLIFNLQ